MKTNSKIKNIRYIDVYGRKLLITKTKNEKISFTLCHDEIIENTNRQEFKDVILNIDKNSNEIYNVLKTMYDYFGNRVIISDNPICDGRNYMYLLQQNEGFYMIFNHDLANELRNPFKTKIEISDRYINDLYEENLGKSLTKRLHS